MPEVKEGSVIEYQYKIVSDRLTSLRTWEFQKAIPVKWSEYLVEIPEYFNYLKISTGYEPFAVNEIKEEIRSETFVEFTKTYSRYGIQGPQTSTSKLDYKATCYHWAIENAPGLKDESFVGNVYDYLTKVEFQLSNYKFPGYQFENVLGSWEDINDQLLTHNEDFKSNISGKRFYQDELNLILSQCETGEEKMRGIYRYVTTRMQWDGVCDFIPNQPVKKTYDGRTGSAADINALLISMLRAAGLNCEPVLLSTRDNGQVHPIYPIMHKYNYLIAMVIIDGKSYLLDATEKNIPPGMLPVRCLNQRGRCISKTKGNWINLQPSIGSQETFICNLKLDNEVLTGNMQTSLKGYTGISCNKKYTMNGEEKYLEALLEKHKDWEVENYNVTNENPCHDGFKEKFNVVIKNAVYEGGNRLYIDPVLVNRWDENPLKNESRKFPVDFNYPILSKYISNIIVPEGYEIEEIPESIQFSLPDKSATFIYLVKKLGNTIQLMNQFEIKKSIYSVEEYKPLREFWSLVVSKNKEQIVLKKIETHEF
jgi:hypothetical protein